MSVVIDCLRDGSLCILPSCRNGTLCGLKLCRSHLFCLSPPEFLSSWFIEYNWTSLSPQYLRRALFLRAQFVGWGSRQVWKSDWTGHLAGHMLVGLFCPHSCQFPGDLRKVVWERTGMDVETQGSLWSGSSPRQRPLRDTCSVCGHILKTNPQIHGHSPVDKGDIHLQLGEH